jgi:hypothetical protein
LLSLDHSGMDDGVKGLKTPASKGEFRQLCTIQSTVGTSDFMSSGAFFR